MQIKIFRANEDNYLYLIHDEITGSTALIDASDENAVLKTLDESGWTLSDIFITHHHWDHTDALLALKKRFNVKVTGPLLESAKISGLDRLVKGGDRVKLGSLEFDILDLGGHTNGHIGYFEIRGKHLFSGDALFSLGCGRMFEGTPKQMWAGLERIKQLPDDTKIYCGHEYSAANAAFALSIDANNEMLRARQTEIEQQLTRGEPTIPVVLKQEKATNPFLRADDMEFAKVLNMQDKQPSKIFAHIRKAKDNF